MKREPINPNSVYSREEAAELLGVSLSTIKRLIAGGQLAASRGLFFQEAPRGAGRGPES